MRTSISLTVLAFLTACGGMSNHELGENPDDGVTSPGENDDSNTSGTTSGSSSETLPVPECYAGEDIQTAIDQASNGDTVLICAGVHQVNLEIPRNITLDVEEPALQTTLDGGGTDPVILVLVDRRLTVRNLEIINGEGGGNWAGGIEAADASDLVVEYCDVHDNHGMIGGIQGPYNGSAALFDVLVRDNTGDYAGGMGIGTGSLVATEITGNHATLRGGGVWVYPFQGPLITDTLVASNTTDGMGGGVALDWASVWRGGTIEDNTAAEGGGIGLLNSASVGVWDVVVQHNTATIAGGGFANALSIGGPMAIGNTTFTGNSAPLGGGLYIQQTSDGASYMDITDLTADGNTADDGAGLALSDIDVTIVTGTLIGNVATLAGGGISLKNGATVTASGLDVGLGPAGNSPEDVDLGGQPYEYDGTVAFTCDIACL